MLKIVIAIIRPHSAERVIDALGQLSFISGCSIREVKGFGRQKSYLNEYAEGEYSSAYVSKAFVMFTVPDMYLQRAIDVVIDKTRTGRIGDGKIFVLSAAETSDFLL